MSIGSFHYKATLFYLEMGRYFELSTELYFFIGGIRGIGNLAQSVFEDSEIL